MNLKVSFNIFSVELRVLFCFVFKLLPTAFKLVVNAYFGSKYQNIRFTNKRNSLIFKLQYFKSGVDSSHNKPVMQNVDVFFVVFCCWINSQFAVTGEAIKFAHVTSMFWGRYCSISYRWLWWWQEVLPCKVKVMDALLDGHVEGHGIPIDLTILDELQLALDTWNEAK